MSQRWEAEINRWYSSRTSTLEYLDLAEVTAPTRKDLAHNLQVIRNSVYLSSKVHIKLLKEVQEQQQALEQKVEKLESGLKTLVRVFRENKPLTEAEVRTLVLKISEQPKVIEAQTLQLQEDLKKKLDRVEKLLHKVESWTST